MRFYEIAIDGGKTYTARNNPYALNVEMDLQTYDYDRPSGQRSADRPRPACPRSRVAWQGRRAHRHAPRPLGAPDARPLEHAGEGHRQGRGLSFDAWADTTTAYGRLMLRRACRVRERIDPRPHGRRQGARQGAGREDGAQAEAHRSPEARSDLAPRSWRGDACGDWPQLQCERLDDFEVGHESISRELYSPVSRREVSSRQKRRGD